MNRKLPSNCGTIMVEVKQEFAEIIGKFISINDE